MSFEGRHCSLFFKDRTRKNWTERLATSLTKKNDAAADCDYDVISLDDYIDDCNEDNARINFDKKRKVLRAFDINLPRD